MPSAIAKLSKNADAPEGPISAGFGNDSFKITDDKPYETDSWEAVLYYRDRPHMGIDVEMIEDGEPADPKAAARAESKALNELTKERAKVNDQRATKDPLEPAAPMPETVADLAEGNKEAK